jgi:hypothetical protein
MASIIEREGVDMLRRSSFQTRFSVFKRPDLAIGAGFPDYADLGRSFQRLEAWSRSLVPLSASPRTMVLLMV